MTDQQGEVDECDVLILGGSFTGIELVRRLRRDRVGRALRIRVVDRQREHLYIPLGHELLCERLPFGVEAGTVLASASNSVGTRSVVIGRLLCSSGQITLLSNTISLPTL